jgi:hypothetical protein
MSPASRRFATGGGTKPAPNAEFLIIRNIRLTRF